MPKPKPKPEEKDPVQDLTLAKDFLSPYPRVKAQTLHRQLDEILEWKPKYARYACFKWMLLRWIGETWQAMNDDRSVRTKLP